MKQFTFPEVLPRKRSLKRDRIDYWMGVGAQPSDTVKRLLRVFDERFPREVEPTEPKEAEVEEQALEAKAAVGPPTIPDPLQPGQPGDADGETVADDDWPDELDVELAKGLR